MVFFPVMVNTIRGLTNVDPAALELLSSYAAGDRQTLRKLRVPNALPYWFTALQIATTLSVIGAVVGEFFGGPLYALGIYITLETGASRYPSAWAAIVLACVLGIVLYLVAVALERLVDPVVRGARDGSMTGRRVAYHRCAGSGHRAGRPSCRTVRGWRRSDRHETVSEGAGALAIAAVVLVAACGSSGGGAPGGGLARPC